MLGLFCLMLFGYAMFSGRSLSLHEARLPELSREMMRDGNWLIPRSGGRPWLERPPLPHWVTISISMILRQSCDSVWVVRLPAVLAGCLTVLLTASMAARWFGRSIGILSGLVLATAFEFYVYACRAEDDIFLAALVAGVVALFVYLEFPAAETSGDQSSFMGSRPWPVPAFFALLGLTSLAKGPLLGAAVVIPTIATFLLSTRDTSRIRKYVWLWGWLLFLVLTAAWPVAVYMRFGNEALNYWIFDYVGTTVQDQPVWWYLRELPWCLAPWTPAALVGLWGTAGEARRSQASGARFLWCWAIVPVIVLSLSHRKHHHYLVPSLAPWAVLSALGLRGAASLIFRGPVWPRRPVLGAIVFGLPAAVAISLFHSKIPGPLPVTILVAIAGLACVTTIFWGLSLQSGRIVMAAFVALLAVAYSWGQSFIPDLTTQDTLFLRKVEITVPRGEVVFVNADLHGELDFFRICFYLGEHAKLLYNLTFLRDERIKPHQAYEITRAKDQPLLGELGTTRIVLQSEKTRRERGPADRFTLFLLRFDPALRRYPVPAHISTAQAMGREKEPNCGPPL
jgi:4-amino-4-deoxy-L-arabinose transferase-like glycosyltransferase